MESRGKLITVALSRFGDMCSNMIVSVRSPNPWDLGPYFLLLPSRESEPTSSTLSAPVSGGLVASIRMSSRGMRLSILR
jgi:hypothetical protein